MEQNNKLQVIDGETLMDMELAAPKFCVQGLLPQGLCILGGAPKIGKSWLMLDLCVRIAKGEPMWGMETSKGTTLYLCLEDTYFRIQQRLGCITDEVSDHAFFANASFSLAEGLMTQITDFVREHPDTTLVVIDTFQMVRSNTDVSYGNDYEELAALKRLADELRICILLVHHLRKLNDKDPLNRLSGTTGIAGAVDAVFILAKDDRQMGRGKLTCTGRDVEDRELELWFNKESCTWELQSDSLESPEKLLPEEMQRFISFMAEVKNFSGSNTELAEQFNAYAELTMTAKSLKQMMNRWRLQLREQGITFRNRRSNSQRLVEVFFSSAGDTSDASDA